MRKSIVALLHLGYWFVYLVLVSSFFLVMPGAHKPPLGQTLFLSKITVVAILPALIGFYSFYAILFNRFLHRKKIISLFFFSILTSAIGGLLVLLILYLVFGSRYVFNDGWDQAIAETLFFTSLAFVNGVIALVMKGFISWYSEIKLKEELNKKNYEMELELIKSQINPHFLFNTINNIDVLIEKDATKASRYLNKLSDIMRFMLYETKNENIPLTRELAYIEKYIDLQKIRTSNPNYINYSVDGEAGNLMIAPMLFIPFIENAFKHAENKKMENAITIRIAIRKDKLSFYCENSYKESQIKQDRPGLGNELIQKRLALLYPNQHTLNVTNDKEIYTANLTLYYNAN